MFGSCTTVWSMARLASQTPAESGPRGWSVTGECSGRLSRVYAPHSIEFGANFSRASAGRIAALFMLCIVRDVRCWLAAIANGCSTQVLYSPSS